jgi:hypothetical protein
MPNYNPKPGKKFQKGQVANPLGAAAHNPMVKAVRNLTKERVAEIIEEILTTDPADAHEMKGKAKTVMEAWLMAGIQKAVRNGDLTPLNALLDRLIGKVKDQVENSGETTARVIIENYVAKARALGDGNGSNQE